MSIVSDLQWKDATAVAPIMEALMSYITIMGEIHPVDYGPLNILRSVIKWRHFDFRSNQVQSLKQVANGIMARNASFAASGEPPMNTKDSDVYIRETLQGMGGPSSIPDYLSKKDQAALDNSSSSTVPPTKKTPGQP